MRTQQYQNGFQASETTSQLDSSIQHINIISAETRNSNQKYRVQHKLSMVS